jgi:hypothetical protein
VQGGDLYTGGKRRDAGDDVLAEDADCLDGLLAIEHLRHGHIFVTVSDGKALKARVFDYDRGNGFSGFLKLFDLIPGVIRRIRLSQRPESQVRAASVHSCERCQYKISSWQQLQSDRGDAS